MRRCLISHSFVMRVVLVIAATTSLLWLFSVDGHNNSLRDDDARLAGQDEAVPTDRTGNEVAVLPDADDAYSSLYCVGSRFVDPLAGSAAAGDEGGPADGVRVDVVQNGVFLPSVLNRTELNEQDVRGSPDIYYFPIYNRTCLYSFVYFDQHRNKFFFYLRNTSTHRRLLTEGRLQLPPVSLSSRPLEVPRVRASALRRQAQWAFVYAPTVVLGRRPRNVSVIPLSQQQQQQQQQQKHQRHQQGQIEDSVPYHDILVAYFLPTVAPWNFAHTLLCDLFGFFWGHVELQRTLAHLFPNEMRFLAESLPEAQLLVTSFRYFPKFPLPNSNKAFAYMSRRAAMYDVMLPSGVYRGLLAGTGTKSWSWVTTAYAASGSPALWYAFRQYIIRLTQAHQPVHRLPSSSVAAASRPLRVSLCHKEDKRGIANSQELLQFLRARFEVADRVEFVLESVVGRSAREQVEMMLVSDVFVCNEGTLATTFFLMNPGSVFLAVPLVYHSPHLHQRNMPRVDEWWTRPDIIRVDPRFNTGGNIDWFPPVISWVRVAWYNAIPLSEVSIQQPLRGLRNYMPDYNIRIDPERFAVLMKRAIEFIRGQGTLWDVQWGPNPFLWRATHRGTWSSMNNNHKNFGGEVGQEGDAVFPLGLQALNGADVLADASNRAVFYLHESDDERDRFRGRTHRPPNYSITADQCRRLLHLHPGLATSFNTALCRYGMSWLCEFFANGRYQQRFFHDKWQHSGGRCGGAESWPGYWLQQPEKLRAAVDARASERDVPHDLSEAVDYFFDLREQWNLSQFLYFSKEQLLMSYRVTDLGDRFSAEEDAVRKLFG